MASTGEDSVPLRRVSNRKRSSELSFKTPRKNRKCDKNSTESELEQYNPQPVQATATVTQDHDESIAQWLDNSFFNAGYNPTRKYTSPSKQKPPSRKANNSKVSTGSNDNGKSDSQHTMLKAKTPGMGGKLHEGFDDSGDALFANIEVPDVNEGVPLGSSQNESIFSGLAVSTPNKLLKNSQPLVPTTPESYATQHESFNESDPLFSEYDCPELQPTQFMGRPLPFTQNPYFTQPSETQALNSTSCEVVISQCGDKTQVSVPNVTRVFEKDDSLLVGVDCLDDSMTNPDKTVVVQKISQPSDPIQLNSCERNTKFASHTSSTIPSNMEVAERDTPKNTGMKSPVKSFRERLKNKLLQNSKVPTPQPVRTMESRRQEMVEQALKEAAELRKHVLTQPEATQAGNFYGLSDKVKQMFDKHRGITKLYDWQNECLSLPALKSHSNLIYSLPTSGGKTLVAEILMLQEILLQQRDTILILPFVSIVQEKVRGLTPFAVDLNFLVEEYAASKGSFPPKKRQRKKSVYICTIEKANSLVNSLIENKWMERIGLVVVDELHMLGEGGSRGATLEMSLAKVMHASPSTQIVGMSATLNNIEDLQTFLHAEVYSNDFRPVKLTEYVKIEDLVFEVDHSALNPDDRLKHHSIISCKYSPSQMRLDPDRVGHLVMEVIPKHSCLVFCPTKKNCENVAELVCKMMSSEMLKEKETNRYSILQALLYDGNGEICPILRRTIPYGVAYHHSGLTMDERKLIEEAYSEGTLCMLACTSTLAAGVNLPAKRVILRSPYVAAKFLSSSQYKQMIGRAGRAGIDTTGESILILQKRDKTKLHDLVSGPYDYCRSSLLYENKKGIRCLLLTTIGLQITDTTHSVCSFLKRTLCHVQRTHFDLDLLAVAKECLQNLLDLGLIMQKKSQGQSQRSQVTTSPDDGTHSLEVTRLGKAVMKGSIDLDRGPQLYTHLKDARESLVVANYLHLLYLVTPYDMAEMVKPNWMVCIDEIGQFDSGELRVCGLIGITDSYVARKIAAQKIRKPVEPETEKRFYLTLMLYNLWKQKSIWDVAAKFNQTRGFIQQLLNGAAAFAACVTYFCKELEEFWAYQDLLTNFVKRLSYCVTMELIPLLEIPGVKIGRARQLYTAGFRSLQLIAYAEADQLMQAVDHLPRRTATQIISSAKMLLTEKAESLIEEAGELIAMPTESSVKPGNVDKNIAQSSTVNISS